VVVPDISLEALTVDRALVAITSPQLCLKWSLTSCFVRCGIQVLFGISDFCVPTTLMYARYAEYLRDRMIFPLDLTVGLRVSG